MFPYQAGECHAGGRVKIRAGLEVFQGIHQELSQETETAEGGREGPEFQERMGRRINLVIP